MTCFCGVKCRPDNSSAPGPRRPRAGDRGPADRHRCIETARLGEQSTGRKRAKSAAKHRCRAGLPSTASRRTVEARSQVATILTAREIRGTAEKRQRRRNQYAGGATCNASPADSGYDMAGCRLAGRLALTGKQCGRPLSPECRAAGRVHATANLHRRRP